MKIIPALLILISPVAFAATITKPTKVEGKPGYDLPNQYLTSAYSRPSCSLARAIIMTASLSKQGYTTQTIGKWAHQGR